MGTIKMHIFKLEIENNDHVATGRDQWQRPLVDSEGDPGAR